MLNELLTEGYGLDSGNNAVGAISGTSASLEVGGDLNRGLVGEGGDGGERIHWYGRAWLIGVKGLES